MRIVVAAVGRLGGGRQAGAAEGALYEHYAKRITFPLALKEITVRRRLVGKALSREECRELLKAVPKGAVIVALDEAGKALSSAGFAERLRAWRDSGVKDVAFLIGGAGGLDDKAKASADMVLSFGPMTWPHLLARGLLAEQIYRAQCILSGHPYHRE